MKMLQVQFELFNWWHAGSGEAGPGDLDATVVRDDDGLPYLPGKTVKGLFRDAALLIKRAQPGILDEGQWIRLFGPGIEPGAQRPEGDVLEGALSFTSARLPKAARDWIGGENPEYKQGLYEALASTAMKDGIARVHSLRRIEVALPVTLEAEVEWEEDGVEGIDTENILTTSAALIRRLGSHRHRGLGRCRVTLKELQAGVGQ